MSRPLNIAHNDNPLHISWHDSSWIPFLNASNVMEYFAEKSNSFYDRTSNNEIIRMQRQSIEQLKNMVGIEYVLLHVKEPILYVVRKQHRHTPEDTTPLADYYIIAGRVYQAPDLASVFNSRILSTVHHLQQAFDDASSFAKFHPTKGYTWDFSTVTDEKKEVKKEKPKEEPSSHFQRQRVDMLLGELLRTFPIPQNFPSEAVKSDEDKTKNDGKTDAPVTVKQEPIDTTSTNDSMHLQTQIKQEPTGPPEKKSKMN